MKIYHILTHSIDIGQHPELQGKPENFKAYNGHPNRLVRQLIRFDRKKEFKHVMVNLSSTLGTKRYETRHVDGYKLVVLKTNISIRDPVEFSQPLIDFVRSIDDGIIHVHGISSFIYDSIAPLLTNKPSIAHARGGNFTWKAFPVSFPKYILLAPFTLCMPKKLFIQNKARIKKYEKYYLIPKEKMVHIPNGIDLEKFRKDKKLMKHWLKKLKLGRETKIFFAGRLEKSKGVLELISAFEQVQKQHKVKLIIAGTGDLYEQLHARKNPDIILLGRVNDMADIAALHNIADIFALPSYSEGFPNTVMEAMACGKAVITTPTDGALDLVDDKTGLLVEVGNARQLETLLNKLVENPTLRKQLGEAARKKIEQHFTWEKIAPKIFQEYRKIWRD